MVPLSRHQRTSGGLAEGPLVDENETILNETQLFNATKRDQKQVESVRTRKRSRNGTVATEPSKSTGGNFANRRNKNNQSVSSAESVKKEDAVKPRKKTNEVSISSQLRSDATRMATTKRYAAAGAPGAALGPSAQYKLAN